LDFVANIGPKIENAKEIDEKITKNCIFSPQQLAIQKKWYNFAALIVYWRISV
jgi:hypothetical protein